MDDLDNIMSELGISTTPTHTEEVRILTDEDYNEILSNYESTPSTEPVEDNTQSEDNSEEELEEGIDEAVEQITTAINQQMNRLTDIVSIPNTLYDSVHIHTGNVATEAPTILEDTTEENTEDEEEPVQEDLIQPNSQDLLTDERSSRFSGMEWVETVKSKTVILAGVGGIGSWLALQLARVSPRYILLYDDDIVETANMSGQFYNNDDVGRNKVDALYRKMYNYGTESSIYCYNRKFTASTAPSDIMMCGFDSIEARRTYFNSWNNHVHDLSEENRSKCLFLDGRLSVDVLQVLCITGDDEYNMQRYREQYLFSSEEAEQTVCSMKQTTYLACMIGSIMTNLFINWCANQTNPFIPYTLPFFTEYDAKHMIFKYEQ